MKHLLDALVVISSIATGLAAGRLLAWFLWGKTKNPVFVCHYPCGCEAKGPMPLPPYCPEHGIIERDRAALEGK